MNIISICRVSLHPLPLILMLLLLFLFPQVGYGDDASECKPEITVTPEKEKANFGRDREITTTVCVGPGTYYYNFVNIHGGGKLIFLDATIDFWAKSILVENKGSLIAGSPDAPIGAKNIRNILTIHLYGEDQGKGIQCRTTTGPANAPDEICGVSHNIWNQSDGAKTKVDLPAPDGTPKDRIPRDYFYKYKNLPTYDDQTDGDYYFGRKALAVSYGGTIRMFGKKGASYKSNIPLSSSETSWVRLTRSVTPKEIVIMVDRAVDWQKDDRIVLTTTDYLPGHSEMLTIDDIDDSKTLLTVDKKVDGRDVDIEYPHNGQKYSLAAVPQRLKDDGFKLAEAETRAAVALLSRNIRIVSEKCGSYDPAQCKGMPEEPGTFFGGHTIVRQGVKQYQVQGVEFHQLGQGGRMSHSPVNFHLVRQAPPDTFVKDCSVNESMTRWFEIRGTQNVTLERNVGWKSIGHGYFLADGSEANNVLRANIGVYARPAVGTYDEKGMAAPFRDNPRMVPGALGKSNPLTTAALSRDPFYPKHKYCQEIAETMRFSSDYVNPSVFFIMNAYNSFEYNMAAGAGTCGACYWIVPSQVGGPSAQQIWEGYANIQKKITSKKGDVLRSIPGTAPIKSFKGNFCSTAMHSLVTVGNTGACGGVSTCSADTSPDKEIRNDDIFKLIPIANSSADKYKDESYPDALGTSFLQPVRCRAGAAGCLDSEATPFLPCIKGQTDDCVLSVIDSYTSSFHWANLNFGAIWLRSNWFLVTDSVLSDVLQGGLTMVSGGSYDQVINGYWGLTRQSAFIGNTQKWVMKNETDDPDGNAFAANAGPFNQYSGIRCDDMLDPKSKGHVIPAAYCLSRSEGISMPTDNFANYQRLYNIYDGPVYQEANAYLDIKKTPLKCTGPAGQCFQTQYMFGGDLNRGMGIPRAKEYPFKGKCILPNAAIGWKQPNGFYYPPAFHSRNLFFDNVDIRHYIVVPLFAPGTMSVNTEQVKAEYCTYDNGAPQNLFATSFTDVDRQTELNDDDGSLAGLAGSSQKRIPAGGTISVNRDKFFQVPSETLECLSEQSCFQVPYDYVSAVVYPDAVPKKTLPTEAYCPANAWCDDCMDQKCYGVPLYRQLLKPGEFKNEEQSIRMMGAGIFQRSSLVANKGVYYLDTLVKSETQRDQGRFKASVFEGGRAYNIFLLYAKPETRVTFQIYVGPGLDPVKDVSLVRTGSESQADADFDGEKNTVLVAKLDQESPMEFKKDAAWPSSWIRDYKNGILTVTMDMSDPKFTDKFRDSGKESCRPSTFCTWKADPSDKENGGKCVYNKDQKIIDFKGDDSICAWSVKAKECPRGGCPGFQVKLPKAFKADDSDRRPEPVLFTQVGDYYTKLKTGTGWNYDTDWKAEWAYADRKLSEDVQLKEYSESFTLSAIDGTKKILTLGGSGIAHEEYGYSLVKRLDSSGNVTGWAWLNKNSKLRNGDTKLILDTAVEWEPNDKILVSTTSNCIYGPANPPPPVPEYLWKTEN
jgi:hypothetical protein